MTAEQLYYKTNDGLDNMPSYNLLPDDAKKQWEENARKYNNAPQVVQGNVDRHAQSAKI